MRLYLIVAKGKHQGMPIQVKVDLFVFGSDDHCQLRSRMPEIAPQHAAIITRDRKVFVQDLGSGLPTLVNGELLPPGEQWPLHANDRLSLGPLEFLIQFHEKQLSQRDAEEWALKCLDNTTYRETPDEDEKAQFGLPDQEERATTPSQAAAAILDKLQALRGVVKGRLRIALEHGITVVRFNDIYIVEEAEIGMIRKELLANLTHTCLRVLLDFKNVQRLSSTGAEMLLELSRHLRARGSRLAICRLRPTLQSILQTLNIEETVPHFADKGSAFAGKW
ncbi:MAG: FHA domain-containing protein [Gemmataceae bacterium]|nr:FHA domain-containing protein [Gemmataceae bacterium]